MEPIRFDVYGTPMEVEHDAAGWRVYRSGTDGKRSLLSVSIPDFVTEAELGQFLDDLFHEGATPRHPAVIRRR